ncbi:MAG: ATP-binding protein [Peptococcaceae bacterium]|nr:ATP-binding protein [Peptococcaceae bacterium]
MASEVCDLCGDRGIILQGDLAVPCNCMQVKAAGRMNNRSGLPHKLQECSLEKFNFKYYARDCLDMSRGVTYFEIAKLAYQAAKNFVADFQNDPHVDGLMFTGYVGSGKTYLASSIANALLQKGEQVLFIVVPDLLDQIRATYDSERNSWDYSEFELMESARQVPLLILDDLGANNYTEWSRNKIYSIINYRLNHKLPVIVTTNITPENLKEYLGERTTSRLVEMCKPYRLLVDIDIRLIRRREKD